MRGGEEEKSDDDDAVHSIYGSTTLSSYQGPKW